MTQLLPVLINILVIIIPTQANDQIHRGVRNQVYKSTSIVDAKVPLTNAMETSTTSTPTTQL